MFQKSRIARLGVLAFSVQFVLTSSGWAAPPVAGHSHSPRTVARKPAPAAVSVHRKGNVPQVHKSAGGTPPSKTTSGNKGGSKGGAGQGNRGNGSNGGRNQNGSQGNRGSNGKNKGSNTDIPLEPLYQPKDGERKVLDPDHPGYYTDGTAVT